MLKNQESCILNKGQKTNHFKLERGTRQGEPLSAYLFNLVLEIAYIKRKISPNIKSVNICNNEFLYTLTIPPFFLQNEKSATEVLNNLKVMPQLSSLKINKSKCELAEIGVMKGVKVALCGVECVNLLTNLSKF